MFAHVEDILARNQCVSGVTVGAISVSIRNLRTRNVPAGLTCTDPVGFTALVDSVLAGTGKKAIDRQAGFLYASNVDTAGFGDARHIDTWVHPPADDGKGMPRLPIEETPIHVASGPSTGIRRFGAIGNGINDDSPAIQRAMDSGAAEVCFEPGRYLLNRPVTIPSHVEHVDFGFCDLVLMGYKSEGTGAVVRTINGGRTEVLGGVINIGKPGEVAFVAEDSQQRISTASQAWRSVACHRCAIREIRDREAFSIPSGDMPSRGFEPSRGPQYVIPLHATPEQ